MSEQRMAPERREPGRYPFHHELTARFGDMDSFQHVNNVAVARFYEDGRVAFLRTLFGDWAPGRSGDYHVLVADLHITYLAEVDYPGTYRIGAGISRLGTTSIAVSQAIFRDDRCLGLCDTILVHMSRTGPTPPPADRRARLEAALLQSQTQSRHMDAIRAE